uniref:Probable DNA helicase MCM8 n=1 Tax=Tanacetum cinerariifolium TaxID=118510 RepID=A0A6L2KRT1_TANCI|nr:probable DNA helicase MCM8 [Tanacetum cinerariifolium]
MSFTHTKCGTEIHCNFPDGKFSPPSVCVIHGCKSISFNPIRSSARPIDFQKIRIQELLKFEHHEEGRVLRTLECELIEDLVDLCCIPSTYQLISIPADDSSIMATALPLEESLGGVGSLGRAGIQRSWIWDTKNRIHDFESLGKGCLSSSSESSSTDIIPSDFFSSEL